MKKALQLHEKDNVVVALVDIKAGEAVPVAGQEIHLQEDIKVGHKIALLDIPAGHEVIKYGYPIGRTTRPVAAGCWVHSHNLQSGLGKLEEYTYHPRLFPPAPGKNNHTFNGYRRP
ncbi:UxaA family hydrolase, partial [Neomoorella thermoacetica]